jgi:hypothetical protein
MKSKLWHNIAFYSLLMGWFPFMWLSLFGYSHQEYATFISMGGLLLCVWGSILIMPLMRNNDLFKSIDQLSEERYKYYEATKRLEEKIKQL